MAKRVIRLTESDMNKIVREAVKRVVKETKNGKHYGIHKGKNKYSAPYSVYYTDSKDEFTMKGFESEDEMKKFVKHLKDEGYTPKTVNESKKGLNEEAVGSGNDFEAVNKWVFWCFNWEPIENYAHIFKGAPKEHFIDKFNGCRGDMNRFYAELDSTNRPILVDYVMNNFRG